MEIYTLKSYLTHVFIGFTLFFCNAYSQNLEFTRQDTLRGTITRERAWWDLKHYHLDVTVQPDQKFIFGSNTITYKVLQEYQRMQIDLQPPLRIEQVKQGGKPLRFSRDGNAYYIDLDAKQKVNSIDSIKILYNGKPRVAKSPPWDGGFSWEQDQNKKHFIATSCQGLGASVWWPNKDHMYDEVDSMRISLTVPRDLIGVSNGHLEQTTYPSDSTATFHWVVQNPINNYGVNVNIGDYAKFSEIYAGEKGDLDMTYYVLQSNLRKAKKQFQDAKRMMEAFEYWFGPYPFYEDGYKLVEVPYLGMEHQSSVTYGNGFKNGYLGKDLSKSGWGMQFDFIIIHESGHEWFANSVTHRDIADLWIHESFTAYSESLFVEYHYGKKAADAYVQGTRAMIQNDRPIIGKYGVNHQGSTDMYYKGANMLHTLRELVGSDSEWRNILRGLQKKFYHQTVDSRQIENYLSAQIGRSLDNFFDQYLRSTQIPILEYTCTADTIRFRYRNCNSDFDLPLRVQIYNNWLWIYPTTTWQNKPIDLPERMHPKPLQVHPNFYIDTRQCL